MRTFEYRGFTQAGHATRGLVEALDLKDARDRLSRQGVLAESVNPAGRRTPRAWRRHEVPFNFDTRAAFYRELGSILSAGIPLSGALGLLMDSPEMGANRPVIAGIRDRIAEGVPLAESIGQASVKVSAFEKAVIQTGERAGQLDEVLNRLAGFLEEERALRDRLVTALIYPAVIMVLSTVVALALLLFMLPSFRELLVESGVDLPWLTRVVMAGGRLAVWILPLALLAGAATVIALRRQWQASPAFRVRLDRRFHRMPLLGSFYTVLASLRFTRTLSMLLNSRLPLLDALDESARASGSPWLAERVEQEAHAVRHGATLSDALARVPPLAGTLPGWVRAGEASGDLAGMLEHAGRRMQQVWEKRVTRTMTLIESGLILIVGAGVFLLALSIILPILSLNRVLQ